MGLNPTTSAKDIITVMFEYSCKDVAEELKETVRNSLQHPNDYTLHIISNGSKEGERYIRNKVKVGTESGLAVKV